MKRARFIGVIVLLMFFIFSLFGCKNQTEENITQEGTVTTNLTSKSKTTKPKTTKYTKRNRTRN